MTPNEQVARMERIIGYQFINRRLAVESLYHGGIPICFDGAIVKPERSERVAVLGDSVLNTITIRKWYHTRNGQGSLLSRGQWNNIIHDDLFTDSALDVRARLRGLDVCVIKDPGTGTVSPRMMATTLEAIIGAVFLDAGANGLNAVRDLMDRLGFFEHVLFLTTIQTDIRHPQWVYERLWKRLDGCEVEVLPVVRYHALGQEASLVLGETSG